MRYLHTSSQYQNRQQTHKKTYCDNDVITSYQKRNMKSYFITRVPFSRFLARKTLRLNNITMKDSQTVLGLKTAGSTTRAKKVLHPT